jgi:hypothetical protein
MSTGLMKEFTMKRIGRTMSSAVYLIALHAMQGKSLLVGDVIFLNWSASPATLNRRLSKLARAGFIRYGSDPDGRKKIP